MMDNDKALELLIQFKAELSAAVKAREELVEMKRQAIAMGVSTGDLDEQIRKADATLAALGKKTLPEVHDGVNIFNVHGREMHRLIHEMDRIVPGLGLTLRAAFNPATLGIAATVLIVEQLIKYFEQAKKNAEELKKTLESMPELSGLLGQTHGLADALFDAQLNTEKFFLGLGKSETAAAGINTQLEITLDLIKKNEAAEDSLANKQKQLELDRLKLLRDQHQISEAQYIAAVAATEKQFQQQSDARKDKAAQDAINATNSALGSAEENLSYYESLKADAEEKAERAKKAVENARANVDKTKSKPEEFLDYIAGKKDDKTGSWTPGLVDKQQAAKEKMGPDQEALADFYNQHLDLYDDNGELKPGKSDEANRAARDAGLDPEAGFPESAPEYIALTKQIFEAREKLRNAEAQRESARAALQAAQTAALQPEAQVADVTKNIDALEGEVTKLRAELDKLKAERTQTQTQRAKEKPVDDALAQVKVADDLAKTPAAKDLMAARPAADAFEKYGAAGLSPEQQQNLIAIAEAATGHKLTLKQAADAVEAAAHSQTAFINLVSRLITLLENMRPENAADLMDRVAALESREGIK